MTTHHPKFPAFAGEMKAPHLPRSPAAPDQTAEQAAILALLDRIDAQAEQIEALALRVKLLEPHRTAVTLCGPFGPIRPATRPHR